MRKKSDSSLNSAQAEKKASSKDKNAEKVRKMVILNYILIMKKILPRGNREEFGACEKLVREKKKS